MRRMLVLILATIVLSGCFWGVEPEGHEDRDRREHWDRDRGGHGDRDQHEFGEHEGRY